MPTVGWWASFLITAQANDVDVMRELVAHGATWRHHANSIVTYLVERGANMNVKSKRGRTPLVIAEGVFPGGNTIFSPSTTDLLRKLGAEPSPPDVNRVPTANADVVNVAWPVPSRAIVANTVVLSRNDTVPTVTALPPPATVAVNVTA